MGDCGAKINRDLTANKHGQEARGLHPYNHLTSALTIHASSTGCVSQGSLASLSTTTAKHRIRSGVTPMTLQFWKPRTVLPGRLLDEATAAQGLNVRSFDRSGRSSSAKETAPNLQTL